MTEEKLTRKEKFAALVVLVLGIFLTILLIISIASSRSTTVLDIGNTLTINKSELLNYFRFTITIIIALTSGYLLYCKKKLGWIMGVPFLLFSTILAVYIIWFLHSMKYIPGFILSIIGFLVLLSSLIILFLPSTQQKYKVSKHTYLPTFIFLVVICTLFFFLQ